MGGPRRNIYLPLAFAFGLAAASFFPVLVLGVFDKRTNRQGAVSGMLVGILFTASYIIYFKFINPTAGSDDWWFGISPEGIGALGMLLNFAVWLGVSRATHPPSADLQALVDEMRLPRERSLQD